MQTFKANKEDVIVFFDMDGVLAEWRSWAGKKEYTNPAYFESLPGIWPAICCARILDGMGVDVRIVSSVLGPSIAEAKKRWLMEHGLGELHATFPICGEDKYKAVSDSSNGKLLVLVDDYTANLAAWQKSGGVAIKFLHGNNGLGGKWIGPRVNALGGTFAVLDGIMSTIETFYNTHVIRQTQIGSKNQHALAIEQAIA